MVTQPSRRRNCPRHSCAPSAIVPTPRLRCGFPAVGLALRGPCDTVHAAERADLADAADMRGERM